MTLLESVQYILERQVDLCRLVGLEWLGFVRAVAEAAADYFAATII